MELVIVVSFAVMAHNATALGGRSECPGFSASQAMNGMEEARMQGMIKAVGFYWTLPVPWAGFNDLPADVDEAAGQSRTIRYQRDLIRRYARDHAMDLIHEAVFLEIEPDRGTSHVRDALRKVEELCRAHGATLLIVDFSEVQGWRSHAPLQDWARASRVDVRSISPDGIMMDGRTFDPHRHFSDWRKRQRDWIESKPARAAACRDESRRHRAGTERSGNAETDRQAMDRRQSAKVPGRATRVSRCSFPGQPACRAVDQARAFTGVAVCPPRPLPNGPEIGRDHVLPAVAERKARRRARFPGRKRTDVPGCAPASSAPPEWTAAPRDPIRPIFR
jgi:hypothetical protein